MTQEEFNEMVDQWITLKVEYSLAKQRLEKYQASREEKYPLDERAEELREESLIAFARVEAQKYKIDFAQASRKGLYE